MIRVLDFEKLRIVVVSAVAPILGFYTPTTSFLLSLVIMFGFNIWAGMRADGVTVTCCRPFSFSKFRNALWELLLYGLIIEVVFTVMFMCGDYDTALLVIKSLTYIFMYVYLQNAFRNLIIAYPRTMALRIIYHVIRLEFTRALPSYLQPIIDRYVREHDKDITKDDNNNNDTAGTAKQ